jgi:K+-transporting ATPase A subunit
MEVSMFGLEDPNFRKDMIDLAMRILVPVVVIFAIAFVLGAVIF